MPLVERDLFRRLCLARELLRDAGEEPLSVREVAERVTVSPFHFIRRFEQLFGTTPNRFRTNWRIERAKELLALGEHSVTEACMQVGFSSVGSFSALFTRRVGLTPSEYRRQMRVLVTVPGVLPAELVPGCFCLMGQLAPSAFRNYREA
jgi:AraC-like DNA-binding protein